VVLQGGELRAFSKLQGKKEEPIKEEIIIQEKQKEIAERH